MIRSFALRFGLFIGLACAFWGANPAHAAFVDLTTMYSQVQLLLNGFTEKAKAGGSTTEGYLKLDDVQGVIDEFGPQGRDTRLLRPELYRHYWWRGGHGLRKGIAV